jgi:ATP-binding cassette subfamily B protein
MDSQRELYEQWCEANENLNATMIEYIQGMPAIKAFNRPSRFFAALGRAIDDSDRLEKELVAKWYWPMAVFTVGSRAGLAVILPLGGWLYLEGELTAGALVLLLLLGLHFGSGFLSLLFFGAGMEQNRAGIERINGLLASPAMPQPSGDRGREPGRGLVGRDLVFSYPQGPEALRGIDFSAPAGRILALVGPSGSGKTTLARLMARFWDPDQGKVLFGEVDARQINWPRLMRQVAFVFQETHLFSGTIAENIALGRPGADRRAIEACARQAQCHEFIARLPQDYDTRLGSRGVQLSGGERQRLCIARALLKDAPVVILDEATSFLDPLCEAEVQKAISHLCRGKTVVVIAHRLETVAGVEEIILLDQGLVAACGIHEELLSHSPLYAELWNAQQDAANWKIGR